MEVATNTKTDNEFSPNLLIGLREEFEQQIIAWQTTCDKIPTIWVQRQNLLALLTYFRDKASPRFEMLFDITAIDERMRVNRQGQPESEFSVVYHLMSFSGNRDFRIKVPLMDADLNVPTIVGLWPAANWYERETWDLYGVMFSEHPDLRRLLTDYGFDGHPLRKDFPLTGNVEVRYDEEQKRVVYEPVKLSQEYRDFDFESPWEGTKYIEKLSESAKKNE